MNKHNLYPIYFSEFTARFCVWSILSQLLMYLSSIHWKTDPQQLYLVGASISILYMSSILGGLVKDYLFTSKLVIIFGLCLITSGFLMLLYCGGLYAGLGLLLIGAGMVTPNTPLLLASHLSLSSNQDRSFTILYGVTNAGIILGSVLGGLANDYMQWKGVIILNSLMVMAWIVSCVLGSWLSEIKSIDKVKFLQFIILILLFVYVAFLYLKYEMISKALMIIAFILYISFLIFVLIKCSTKRREILISLYLTFMAIVFFSAEFQVASTLISYAHNFVQLKLTYFSVPAGSLLALESLFVVVGAFFMTRLKLFSRFSNVQAKVMIGLLMGAFGFLVLYVSTFLASHGLISLWWIVVASLLLGLGDIYIMPSVMSYVAEHAPTRYKGRVLAGMYFSLSMSGYLSGLLSSILFKDVHSTGVSLSFYSVSFESMFFLLGVASVILLATKTMPAIFFPKV